jgi:small-conductance mechanosensitive channel
VAIVHDLIEDKEFREPIHQHLNGDAVAPQVACGDFTNNCWTIYVAYWFSTAKSAEFAKHSERLNLRILEEFEKAGIRLAAAK